MSDYAQPECKHRPGFKVGEPFLTFTRRTIATREVPARQLPQIEQNLLQCHICDHCGKGHAVSVGLVGQV